MEANETLALILIIVGVLLMIVSIASIVLLKTKIGISSILIVLPLFLIVSGFYTNQLGLGSPNESGSEQSKVNSDTKDDNRPENKNKSNSTDNSKLIDRGRMSYDEIAKEGLIITTKGEQEVRFTVKRKYKFEILDEQLFELVRVPSGRSSSAVTIFKDIHYMKDEDGKVFPAKILTDEGNTDIRVAVLNAESMKALKASRG